MDDLDALEQSAGRAVVTIGGIDVPIGFEPVASNPNWLGGTDAGTELYHWLCRLGGADAVEFHHTQSWPVFDPAVAVGCLLADAQDVTTAGSLPEWSRHCGYDPETDVSEIFSRLAVAYDAIVGFTPRVAALLRSTGDATAPSTPFAA